MLDLVKRWMGSTTLSNPKEEKVEQKPKLVDAMPGEKPIVMLDEHQVRAAKEYVCNNCKQTIFKTQVYRRICWKDPNERHPKTGRKGVMHMDRVHLRCWE